jgi:hypothetical protein
MRRLVTTGAVLAALLPAGVVVATTPPDTTPPESVETTPGTEAVPEDTMATETTMATESSAVEGSASAPADTTEAAASALATIYDDSGNPVAAVTASGAQVGWSDYEDGNDPEAGSEYVRVTVMVESLVTEGTFSIAVDDFILQDNNGFITTAENVPSAAEAGAEEETTTEAELANGESVEFSLTFEVVSSVGPQSIFYRPDDDRLVDVAEVG